MSLPIELVNNILSFRPTHPVAKVFVDYRDKFMVEQAFWSMNEMLELDGAFTFAECWFGFNDKMRLIEKIVSYEDESFDYDSINWPQFLIDDYTKICKFYSFGGI